MTALNQRIKIAALATVRCCQSRWAPWISSRVFTRGKSTLSVSFSLFLLLHPFHKQLSSLESSVAHIRIFIHLIAMKNKDIFFSFSARAYSFLSNDSILTDRLDRLLSWLVLVKEHCKKFLKHLRNTLIHQTRNIKNKIFFYNNNIYTVYLNKSCFFI